MKRFFHGSTLGVAVIGMLLCGMAAGHAPQQPERSYRLPYRMSETLHLVVRAKFNGKGPFNFIVDTGAPAMFVTTDLVRRVGVEKEKDGWAKFEEMEIEGGAKITGAQARVEDIFQIRGMNSLGLPGVRLDGVIGYNILARFRMQIDFSKTWMYWTELDFEPPLPEPLGGNDKSAPPELEMVGSLMQGLGVLFRRGDSENPTPRGSFGLGLVDRDESVQVSTVFPGTPASSAGLMPGDTLVSFAGKAVRSIADVLAAAARVGIGEEVRIVVMRGNEKLEVTVTAGRGF